MRLSAFRPLAKRIYRHLPRGWTGGVDLYQRRRHGGSRPPARLDVMTALGGHDADVLQVLLLSLSEAHPRDRIRFWLFHLSLEPAQVEALARFCEGLPNLDLHEVRITDRAAFDRLSKLGGRPFGARFLWMVAHLHLPADLDRVIFLDPLDIIVTDDLLPFLNQPLLGRYVAACRESPSRPPLLTGPAERAHARGASADALRRLSMGIINSGAMVLNLARLRRDGIDMDCYLRTGVWANERMGISFGDQGLFSMTHGSHYAQAHDRYNFRFHDAAARDRRGRVAVVHFAGRIAKPFHLRLSDVQERRITDHLAATGDKAFRLNPHQTIKAHDLAYYRQWWQICARTPVHDRIAPLAAAYTATVMAEQGLGCDQTAPPDPVTAPAAR